MKDRRPRKLSAEEAKLWDRVRHSAEPLRPEDAPPPEARGVGADAPAPAVAEPVVMEPAKAPPKKRAPGAPTKIDRNTLTRIARGAVEIDARVDLHGLTQLAAHARLKRFLATAQQRGHKVVLVITGRGDPAMAVLPGEERRGVLRQAVPLWLASPEFVGLVSGYGEAARNHGGSGALYVRIRRGRLSRPVDER